MTVMIDQKIERTKTTHIVFQILIFDNHLQGG